MLRDARLLVGGRSLPTPFDLNAAYRIAIAIVRHGHEPYVLTKINSDIVWEDLKAAYFGISLDLAFLDSDIADALTLDQFCESIRVVPKH